MRIGKQTGGSFQGGLCDYKVALPTTGVLNFFKKIEPLLAISFVSAGAHPSGRYVWRSYLDDHEAGVARKIFDS